MGSLAEASTRIYPGVSDTGDVTTSIRTLISAVNRILIGKMNATGRVTLRTLNTTTTLSDSRIGANSVILFMATTANAGLAAVNAVAPFYVSARTKGSCTLNHLNSANADMTFDYIIIG